MPVSRLAGCRSIRVVSDPITGKQEAQVQYLLAVTLLFKVARAGFQQIVEGNQALELMRFAVHDGHTRDALLRHAVHQRAKRFIGIGNERVAARDFFDLSVQQRGSLDLATFANVARSRDPRCWTERSKKSRAATRSLPIPMNLFARWCTAWRRRASRVCPSWTAKRISSRA